MSKKIVIVSGGFDPIHIGHVRMIEKAVMMGDRVIIIVNNDNWIRKKKGYVFMPERERLEIAVAIGNESTIGMVSYHKEDFTDRSVCAELRHIRNNFQGYEIIFANGGDRNPSEDPAPEVNVCKELNIAMVYNVGGEKIQSSSDLVKKQKENEK